MHSYQSNAGFVLVACLEDSGGTCQGGEVYGSIRVGTWHIAHASFGTVATLFTPWHEGSHDGTDALNGNRQGRRPSQIWYGPTSSSVLNYTLAGLTHCWSGHHTELRDY